MKSAAFLFVLFIAFIQTSDAQPLTDWQTENVRGKVKKIVRIDQPSEGNEVKKQAIYFDERGFFTLKEIYSGVREGTEMTSTVYTKIGELQFFEYQQNTRHSLSLNADGTKATEIVQQWPETTTCEFTYTYFNKPKNKGTMQLLFTPQAQVKEIHLTIRNKEQETVEFETKSHHQYDAQGYEIQFTQETLQPYGDTQVLIFTNRAFDLHGNIVEKEVYDQTHQVYSKIYFDYEYYE
ncbi:MULTISPECIES: hypothetical protein [unclassified Myroides]|uniref:hypothetical protein n=1 Tax=unclassified Myroides TaxID=2642485 RepID=UPI003D2F9710